jgi:hypothetical protein
LSSRAHLVASAKVTATPAVPRRRMTPCPPR